MSLLFLIYATGFVLTCLFIYRFVRGTQPGHQTGFDIDDSDLREMERCQGVVVASAIFGTASIL